MHHATVSTDQGVRMSERLFTAVLLNAQGTKTKTVTDVPWDEVMGLIDSGEWDTVGIVSNEKTKSQLANPRRK